MSKFIKLAAAAAMLAGLLALAPTAQASPQNYNTHEDAPVPPSPGTPHTVCAVSGQVTTPNTDLTAVLHGEYKFVSSLLECVGAKGGTYLVDAHGGTDGPPQPTVHGSSTALSWSHGGHYEPACNDSSDTVNKGNISAGDSAGWVKFDRVGSAVEAWGSFCNGALVGDDFNAQLVFTPDESGTPGLYDLNGTASIY